MSGPQFSVDMTGAIRKTQTLKAIPATSKRIIAKWLTDTVVVLKRSANRQQRSGPGRHTGYMARHIGQEMRGKDAFYEVLVGTGVGGRQNVKYARIQDEGGITHPTVTKNMRSWAWFMYMKEKDDKWKWLALTKKAKLSVEIPASGWFTLPMAGRELLLSALMNPEALYKAAESGIIS